jgi:hypothetical protein
LQYQVFLRMHSNPFMDEVGIEVVDQCDIGNRGVRLRTFGNDLCLEVFGIAPTRVWLSLCWNSLRNR